MNFISFYEKTPFKDVVLFPIKTMKYPYAASTVFSTKNGASESNGKASDVLSTLKVVDYRYLRFALNPQSGLFTVVTQVISPGLITLF